MTHRHYRKGATATLSQASPRNPRSSRFRRWFQARRVVTRSASVREATAPAAAFVRLGAGFAFEYAVSTRTCTFPYPSSSTPTSTASAARSAVCARCHRVAARPRARALHQHERDAGTRRATRRSSPRATAGCALSFGSFSPGGIAVVELNATAGIDRSPTRRSQCGAAFPNCAGSAVNVAKRRVVPARTRAGERLADNQGRRASARTARGVVPVRACRRRLYLFVVARMDATYELRVGRAAPTGPFVGRDGAPMADGGGALVLGSVTSTAAHRLVGPGHAGILAAGVAGGGDDVLTFDFQGVDGAGPPGRRRGCCGGTTTGGRWRPELSARAGVGVQRAHRRLGARRGSSGGRGPPP